MAKLTGNKPIEIIQGSSQNIIRKFSADTTELIDKVIISCNKHNICEEMQKLDTGEFLYTISAEQSSLFELGQTTYDMTVKYLDGSVAIQTGIDFSVFERKNPPECGGA